MQFVFLVCQVKGYRNILKQSCRPFAFPSFYSILKNQKWSGTTTLGKIFGTKQRIQKNSTGEEKFDIYFCVFFDYYGQSLISERKTRH